ncbi:hypothetical protein [Halomicrobium urmianum]|uniref:hypothetical protein n=1 Tax=Halomicrobium urmianum TaxID=1586233 RepID=UPI001CDA099A|nr:hypothetical protein [Halomicrobium urmianum]
MDERRLYWGALVVFGIVSVADTLVAIPGGASVLDWLTGAAGLIVLFIANQQLGGDDGPAEPAVGDRMVYVVVAAAALYVASTVPGWF